VSFRYTFDDMPDDLYKIPSFLSGTVLTLILVLALLLFHWLLVFPWPMNRIGWNPLGKRGWKIVDYIWLSVGAIALVGSAFQARQILANSMLPSLESLVGNANDTAILYASPESYDGLLCRQFARSLTSPPAEEFNRVVAEYERSCAWAHAITDRVKGIGKWDLIDISSLPQAPKTQEQSIVRYEKEIFDNFENHNAIVRKRIDLQKAQHRSNAEETLAILAPLLAVIALALRITKVTGELRLG
jgi:hypothetical protein